MQNRRYQGCAALVDSVGVSVCLKKFQALRKRKVEMKPVEDPRRRRRRKRRKSNKSAFCIYDLSVVLTPGPLVPHVPSLSALPRPDKLHQACSLDPELVPPDP